MSKLGFAILACTVTLLAAPASVSAAPLLPETSLPSIDQPIEPVSGGCGLLAWRTAWGNCRDLLGAVPDPNRYNYYPAPYNGPYYDASCPPGFWRGPWGHCRSTPYHGRLPNGTWE